MPALFKKDDIMAGEEREEIISFSELYEIPEGIEDPYLKFKINDHTREFQDKTFKKFIKSRVVSYGKDRLQVISPDKILEYVMEMLRVSMIEIKNFIDDPSLPVLRKKLKRSKVATKFLAEKITEAFEKDSVELKKQVEEDEKN